MDEQTPKLWISVLYCFKPYFLPLNVDLKQVLGTAFNQENSFKEKKKDIKHLQFYMPNISTFTLLSANIYL